MRTRKQAGFTLLEVMIVAGIGVIVTATALPNMLNGIAVMRLHSNITSLSGVIQNCRMLAVKQNQAMTTHFSSTSVGVIAYVKAATDLTADTPQNSQVELEAPVVQSTSPSGPGAPPALGTLTLGFTPQTGDPSFNTTGLPCAYSSGVCNNNGFIYYFNDTRQASQSGWAALSISPAGRLKKWYWSGSVWAN
jgi:prepilin-type N-terminal cleavage/methylation domain-containing protein